MAIVIRLLLAALGNWMGKLLRNFYIGIRTPWTIANDEVWDRTHRLSGPLFVIHGLAVVICGLFAPERICFWFLMVGLGAIALLCTVYSIVVYHRLGAADELSARDTH